MEFSHSSREDDGNAGGEGVFEEDFVEGEAGGGEHVVTGLGLEIEGLRGEDVAVGGVAEFKNWGFHGAGG